ncbi:unnamed protein product [Sphagnum jensenii]|uniref:NADH dehydrogenase [ubiquinone] 1 alpha subcomplex subunit 12 n=1 Tax=Sphagnum jensenii TaxID=128206 RepID=A0ABP0VBW6_9BRYO
MFVGIPVHAVELTQVESDRMVGDLKFGVLKGTDAYGNKYYEDLSLPFGQHRWVEYSNIHDFDATMIQPEWHGWMHHTQRGYKVGSRMTGPEDPDLYYKQPGHPLSPDADEKGARFKDDKGVIQQKFDQ